VTIGPGAVIGAPGFGFATGPQGTTREIPQLGGVVIEDDVHVGAQAVVQRGTLGDTLVCRGTRIGSLANISHNAAIGEDVLIVGHAQIGGGVQLERGVIVWQGAVIANGVHVGENAVIGMNATVRSDVPAGEVWAGSPARKLR
jgi:UDP-3-O-[3-hydroxymyristoyl] glucosamine N-acyltransferase